MTFAALPPAASWRHEGFRAGFEVTFFSDDQRGLRIEGATTATEDGTAWMVTYMIRLDASWATRSAQITRRSRDTCGTTVIAADGKGSWQINGVPAPQFQGCLDLDLEASAMTNSIPVHRLHLTDGVAASAPAVFVRTVGPGIDRLEQTYCRVSEGEYAYAAPAFHFEGRLVYDRHGLILDYPGIATRVQ